MWVWIGELAHPNPSLPTAQPSAPNDGDQWAQPIDGTYWVWRWSAAGWPVPTPDAVKRRPS